MAGETVEWMMFFNVFVVFRSDTQKGDSIGEEGEDYKRKMVFRRLMIHVRPFP